MTLTVFAALFVMKTLPVAVFTATPPPPSEPPSPIVTKARCASPPGPAE